MPTFRLLKVGARGRVVGTTLTLLMMNIALASIFGGLQQFFLPSRVGVLAPGEEMTALAVLSATGAAAAAIANPLAGHFSDRTRTTWGRRTPWLTGCTVAAIASLAVLGTAPSLAAISICYAAAMLALGAFQAVLSALVPEEVPIARRGTIVAILTAGLILGPFVGVSLFTATGTTAGLSILALSLLMATIAHVTRPPDPLGHAGGSPADQTVPAGLTEMFDSLRDPDFRQVVLARSILMLGFWAVVSYQLFMLTDLVATERLP